MNALSGLRQRRRVSTAHGPSIWFRCARTMSLLAMLVLPIQNARATDVFWDIDGANAGAGGASPSGNWSTADSTWTIDSTGASAGAAWNNTGADTATFSAGSDATGSYTVTLTEGANIKVLGMTFQEGSVTIAPGAFGLELGASGLTVNASAGPTTIDAGITMTGAQSWLNNSASLLSLTGAINNGGFTLTSGGTGNTTLTGIISNTGGLTKTGAGTLTVSSANTYTGVTKISAGTLSLDTLADGGLTSSIGQSTSAAGNLVLDGGALTYTGAGATTNRLFTVTNNGGTINSSGSGALSFNGVGAVAYTGVGNRTLTLGGTSTDANSMGLNIGDNGADVVSLVKTGAGTWSLTGANTYSGSTTVSGGILSIGSAGAVGGTSGITVSNGASLDLTGGITVNKSLNITGSGVNFTGALESAGGANTWAGNITIGAAGARIGVSGPGASLNVTGVIDSGVNVANLGIRTASGGDVVTLSNVNTYLGGTDVIVGTLRLAGGNDRLPTGTLLTVGNGTDTLAAMLDLNGFNQTVAGLASAGTTMNRSVTSSTAATLTINGSGTNTYGGTIDGSISLIKSGSGVEVLTGTNTYTGSTLISGGVLRAGAASIPATSLVTINGGVLESGANITRTLGSAAGNVQVTGGTSGFSANGAAMSVILNNLATSQVQWGSAFFNPSTLVLNESTANNTLNFQNPIDLNTASGRTINGNSTGSAATISGVISNSLGSGSLTKGGAGILGLSGANTFSGNVLVSAGTLRTGNAAALGTIGGYTQVLSGATLDLNGQNLGTEWVRVAGAGVGGLGAIVNSGAGQTQAFQFVTMDDDATFGGPNRWDIRGGNSFLDMKGKTLTVKGGTGGSYQTLVQTQILNPGNINIASGSYQFESTTFTGGTSANKLSVANGATFGQYGNNQNNPWTLELANGATWVLWNGGGASNWGGPVSLVGGTAQFTTGATATDSGTVNGIISGAGGINKTGAGIFTFTKANTYLGATTMNAGTIVLANPNGRALYNAGGGANLITIGDGTNAASSIIQMGAADQLGSDIAMVFNAPAGASNWSYLKLMGFNTTIGDMTLSGTTNKAVIENMEGETVNVDAALTVNQTSTIAYDGYFRNRSGGTGTGLLGLNKLGTGKITFSGANVIYTGTTNILNGTIGLNGATAFASPILFGAGSTGTLEIASATQSIPSLATSPTFTSAVVTPASLSTVLTVNQAANTTFGGVIQDNGAAIMGLTKSGAGTLELSGVNAFSGALTVSGGALSIATINDASTNGVLGNSANSVQLGVSAGTGTLRYTGATASSTRGFTMVAGGTGIFDVTGAGTNLTLSGIVDGTGAMTKVGAGTLSLSGTNTFSGALTVKQGVLAINTINDASTNGSLGNSATAVTLGDAGGVQGTLRYTGASASSTKAFTMAAGGIGVFDVSTLGTNLTLSGVISGATGNLGKVGQGTLTLSGANTYGGSTIISNGTLALGASNTLPVGTTVTLGLGATTGTLALNGNSQTLAGLITLNSVAGNRVINGTPTASTLTLNIAGANAYAGVLGGATADQNNFGLTKAGTGLLSLSAANTYTGATTVSAGTLNLTGSSASSTITVADGAFLSGKGTTTGSLVVGGGASGTIRVDASTAGAFTANGISFNGGSQVILDGLPATTSPTIVIANYGAGTLTGLPTLANASQYRGTPSAVDDSANTRVTLTLDTRNLAWTGSANGTWDIGTTTNWSDGSAQAFYQGDLLTFGDGPTNNSITLGVPVTPGSVTFTNTTATPYTIGGAGAIAGGTGLVKSGNGTVTLNNANTYSGETAVSNGTLVIGSSTAIQNSTLNLTGTGAVSFAGTITAATFGGLSGTGAMALTNTNATPAAVTLSVGGNNANTSYSGVLSGLGALTKTGLGTLTLSGANSYAGNTVVTSGTLKIGAGNTLAGSAGNVVLDGGAVLAGTLDLNGFDTAIGGLTGTSNLVMGQVINSVAGTKTLTVGGNNASGTFAGNILAGTGDIALTKVGGGVLTLQGSNTYTGTTTVSGIVGNTRGGMTLDFSAAMAPTSNIINSSSALVLSNADMVITGKAGIANSQAFNGTTLNEGYSSLTTNTGAGGNLAVNLGAITKNARSILNFVPGTGTINTTNSNTNGILGGWALFNGNDFATVTGAGVAAATYTNDTWAAGNNTNVSLNSTVALNAVTNSLRFNTARAATLTLAGNATISSGGLLIGSVTGANATTINGGTLKVGGNELDIINNSTGILTINSVLDSGITQLIKSGGGQVNVGANNTVALSGGVTLTGGVLQATANNALGSGTIHIVGRQAAGTRVELAGGVTLSNNFIIDSADPVAGFGPIYGRGAVNQVATVSGNIQVNIATATGGTFATPSNGPILNLTGVITAAPGVGISSRQGNVQFSNAGSSYSSLTVGQDNLILGVDNAIPVNLIPTVGASAAAAIDMRGRNQTLAGLTKGGSAGTVTNTDPISPGLLAISTMTLNTTANNTWAGIFAGPMNVTKTGSATLVLSGTSTNGGLFTASQGLTQVTAGGLGGGIRLAGGTVEFNNVGATNNVSGNGSQVINLTGNNTQTAGQGTFTGANNAGYAGTWNVLGGATNGFRWTLGNTATLATGTGTINIADRGQLYLSGGAGVIANNINLTGNGWNETTGFLGAIRIQNTNVLTGNVNMTGNTRITLYGANPAFGIIGGPLSGAASLEVSLFNGTPGPLTLANPNNTFTGSLSVLTGNAVNAASLTDAASSAIVLGDTANAGTFTYYGNGATYTNRGLTLGGTTGGANVNASGSGALVLNGAFSNSAAGAKTLTLGGLSMANNTIGAALVDNTNPLTVAKTGIGTWVLNASNTFTGGVTVGGGTLRLATAASLPANSPVTINAPAGGLAANLDFNGFNATLGTLTLGGAAATSVPTLNTGSSTITLGNATTALSFPGTNNPLTALITSTGSGGLSLGGATRTFNVVDSTSTNIETMILSPIFSGGTAGITKSGTGVLYLGNTSATTANTINSTVTVSAGVLSVGVGVGGGSNAIGTSAVSLGGGTLRYAPNIYAVTGETNGFVANFYNNGPGANPNTVDFATLSNVTSVATRTGVDTQINATNVPGSLYNIVPGVQGMGHTQIATTYNGLLNITNAGTYTFNDFSDDGSFLYIDGNPVVGTTGVTNQSIPVYLGAGKHTLNYRFAQGGGGVYSVVSYSGPDTSNFLRPINSVGPNVITNAPVQMSVNNAMTQTANSTIDIGANTVNSGTLGFSAAGQTLTFTSTIGSFQYEQAGAVTLPVGTTTITSSTGTGANVLISGNISESAAGGALTKTGNNVLILSGTNTYTGATTVSGGVLRLNGPSALSGGNLTLNGGVVEIQNPSTFSTPLGAAANNVQLTGGTSGFGAFGTAATVNLGGLSGTLTWGGATFNPGILALNYYTSNRSIELQNFIDLNGGNRSIGVYANPAANFGADWAANPAPALMTGDITGALANSALTKVGPGVLVLSGNNNYVGATTVSGGVLRINGGSALSTAGNISLNGGVLELQNPSSFTTAAGTVAGQVQLAGTSGFSAFGGAATVNLGGAGVSQTWGAAPFNPGTFVLNYYSADSTIDFQNALNLNAGTRTVAVLTTAAGPAATISGQITGTGASNLVKTGLGTLVLSNGTNNYAGSTTVNQGTLRLGAANAVPATSALIVSGSSTGMTPVFDLNNFSNTVTGVTMGGAYLNDGAAITTGTGVLTVIGPVSGDWITYDPTNNPLGATISGSGGVALTGVSPSIRVGRSTGSGAVDLTVTAPIVASLATSLTINGAGVMALGANGSINAPQLTIAGGTFIDGDIVTPSNNNDTNSIFTGVGSPNLALNAGTYSAAYATAAQTHSQTFNSLIVSAATSNTVNTVNTAAGTLNLNFNGAGASVYTRSAGGIVNFVPGSGGSAANFSFSNAPTSGVASGILQGAVLNGTDVILAQAGNLTAPTYATNSFDNTNGTNVTANTTIAPDSSTKDIRFDPAGAGSTLTLSGVNTITSGAIVAGTRTGVNRSANFTGGTIRSGASELWIYNDASVGIDSVIADSTGGATSLSKGGSGRLILTQNATYTGGTTIGAGTLQLGNYTSAGMIGTGGLVNNTANAINVNLLSNTTLSGPITGITPTLTNNAGNFANIGVLTLNNLSSSAAFVTLGGSGQYVVNGPIASNINKTGNGNMTLNGAMSGLFTLQHAGAGANVVQLGSTASFTNNVTLGNAGNGTTFLQMGAANQFDPTKSVIFNAVTGQWSYLKAMGFSQDLGTLGATSVAGAVMENTEGEIGANNAVFTFSNAGTINYTGYFRDVSGGYAGSTTGTLGMVKLGAGNLIIDPTVGTGRILFTGPTTVSAGTLTITSQPGWGSQIANNAALVLDYAANTTSPAFKGISGTGTLTKTNLLSTVWVAGASTYTGDTTINGGIYRADDGQGLPAGGTAGNLNLSASVWEMGGNSTRAFGTGGNQVQMSGNSGFSAFANDVTLNFGSGAALTWGSGNFNPGTLFLNVNTASGVGTQANSTNNLTISNNIDMGATQRTIHAGGTFGTAVSTLSGVIAGTAGMVKVGGGTLVLSNTANTFTGSLDIRDGLLSVSTLADTGTGAIGSGAILLGNTTTTGGLRYTGAGATITRGITFNGTTGGGLLDASGSGALVLSGAFTNNSGAKTLTLQGSSAAANTISTAFGDAVDGSLLSVTKTGAGQWILTANNAYGGATNVFGGTLSLAGLAGRLSGATAVSVANGATLLLDNVGGTGTNVNRIPDSQPITLGSATLGGGTFKFQNNAGAFNYSESAGVLTISPGYNPVTTSQAATAQTSALTFASLSRTVGGGTVDFNGTGLGTDTRNTVVFTTAPTLTNTLIGGWAVAGNEFAKYVSTGTISVAPLATADYSVNPAETAWATANNLKLSTGTFTLTAARTANSLNMAQTAATTVALGANSLRLNTGGILISGAFAATISGTGTLLPGSATNTAAEFIINQNSANDATISAIIAQNGTGVTSVTKAGNGAGALILSGANTYTGATVISSGRVRVLGSAVALGTTAGATTVLAGAALEASAAAALNFAEPLTLNGTGISNGGALRATTTFNTWSGAITLGSPARINSDASTFTVSGAVNNAGFGLTVGGTGTILFSGVMSGAGGVTKDGTNLVELNGTNTFTGPVFINQGYLKLSNTSALGTTSQVVVASGGSLSVESAATYAGRPVIINGPGLNTDAAFRGFQNATWQSTIVLGSDSRIAGENGTTLTLTAPQAIVGSGKNLTLGDNRATPGAVDVQGQIILGTGSVSTVNTGTVFLSGVNQWSGGTTVNSSYLRIRRIEALGGSGRDALVNSGGVIVADYAFNGAGTVQQLINRVTSASTGSILYYGQSSSSVSTALAENVDLSASGGTSAYFGLWSNGESANGGALAGPNTFMTGTITPNGSTYKLANAQSWAINTPNLLTGARNLDVGDVNTAGNALFITAKQNFTGSVTVNRNFLVVSDLDNGGADSGLGASSNAASNLVLGGAGTAALPGALVYIGSQNASTDRSMTMINDMVLDLQGRGNATFTGNIVSSQTANKQVYLRANTVAGVTGTFAGNIGNALNALTIVTKDQGLGTWILSGNNTYSGGTSVSAGVLQFNSTAASGGNPVRDITLNAGGSLALNSTGLQSFINSRVIPTAAGTIALTGANAAENVDFSTATGANITGAVSLGAVGDVTYTGTLTPYLPTSAAATATWRLGGGYGTLRFSQVMGDVGTNAVNNSPVTYFGAGSLGTVDLTGNATGNTYTGITTINGSSGVFLDQGASGVVVVNKESLLGANPLAFNATQLTFNHGTLRATASFDIDDANRGIRINYGTTAFFEPTAGVTLGLAAPISSVTGSNLYEARLAKIGAGTLVLTNPTTLYNTLLGDTYVYTGTLKLGANEQITNTTSLRLFGTFDLNGKVETINGLYGYGNVANTSTNTSTLTIGQNNASNTERFNGSIVETSGVINLIKTGTGTMNLIGSQNNFSGSVWVQNGALQLDSIGNSGVGSNGSGAIKLGYASTAGGLYWLGGTATTSRAIDMAGTTGTAFLDGSGNGPVSFTGGTTASGSGTKFLQLQGSYIGSYNGGPGAFGNNTLAGNVTDSAGGVTTLRKTGAGLWLLSGAKTYTGGTIIDQGTLAIDSDSALGASSGTVMGGVSANSVTLQLRNNITFTRNFNTNTAGQYLTIDTNGFDATIGDNTNDVLIAGPGKFRKMGAGTLTLAGTRGNLWIDGVDVTGGKLVADYSNLATNLLPANVGTSGGVGFSGGTLEFKANPTTPTNQLLGTLFPNTGESRVVLNLNGNGANTATIAWQGFNTRQVGSVIDFNVTGSGTGSMTTTQANNTWGIFGGYATFGGNTFAYSNNGTIAGLPNSSYANTVVLGQNVDVPAAGLTINSTSNGVSSIRFNDPAGGSININGAATQLSVGDGSHVGSILVTPNVAAPVSINGGLLYGFGDTIFINNSTQDLIVNTTIMGDQPITKAGPGRLVLTGGTAVGKQPNTGTIYVQQGTILVTGAGVLGNTNNAINIGYAQVATAPAGFAIPTVEIDSPAALVQVTDSIRIGVNGVGAFNQSAGTVRSNTWIEITNALNSVGTYNMSGGTMVAAYTTAGGLIVGNTGQGTFNLSGGEVNIFNNGVYQLARTQGGSGVVNQSGGTVNVYGTFNTTTNAYNIGTGNITVGDAGPATYNQSGGTVNTPSGFVRLGLLNGGTGTYNLTGGTLNTTGVYVGGGSGVYLAQGNSFNLAGGTLKAASNLDVTAPTSIGGAALVNSVIDTNGNNVNVWRATAPTVAAGSLTKNGLGNLNLPNANTYSGGTTINAGKVIASGTSLGTGVVTIAAGAALSLQGSMPGLKGDYYNYGFGGQSNEFAYSSLANFDSVFGDKTPNLTVSTSAGGQTTMDFGAGGANFPAPYNAAGTFFTAKYSGKFNAPTSGNYLFYTASDDSSMLFMDGQNVVYNNYSQGVNQRYGSVFLTAGLHDLNVLYSNGAGGYGMYVDVTVPGDVQKRLANSLLTFEAGGNATVRALASTASTAAVELGNRTLTISDGAGQSFAGVISGTGSLVKSGSGTQTLAGVSTFSGSTTVSAGILQVGTPTSAGSIASSSGVTVASTASFVAGSSTTVKSLNMAAGNANATILAGALRILTVGDGSSDTGLLDISGSGSKLDLNSGAMVLNFNSAGVGTSLRSTIKSLIGTGKIMSSRAIAANLADPNTPVGIGYALGDYTAVGLPSDSTSIVTRYTLVGDANLDGVVDVGDLGTALAPNYGSPSGNYWQSGDFNGDGAVDTSDLALLAANYGKTLTLPGDAVGNLNLNFQQDLAQAFASVPEPGTLSVLGLAALALLKRRNRRTRNAA